MNGVLRLPTGLMALCDEDGREREATKVVEQLHLCEDHAREERVFLARLREIIPDLRNMSPQEILAHEAKVKGGAA